MTTYLDKEKTEVQTIGWGQGAIYGGELSYERHSPQNWAWVLTAERARPRQSRSLR